MPPTGIRAAMTPTSEANTLSSTEACVNRFNGSLRLPGEQGEGLSVEIDLNDETIVLRANAGDIGAWSRRDVRINAMDDGFHLRVEGEEVILDIVDDAHFALACGLTAAPPLLRRKMSAALRERGADHLV